MEKLSVQQKSNKQSKAKKKPIKVVYISTPMKVKASQSEFRAVVQELTGRDSDIADLGKFHGMEDKDEALRAPGSSSGIYNGSMEKSVDLVQRSTTEACPLERYDEDFTSQMLENFPAFMSSSLHGAQ